MRIAFLAVCLALASCGKKQVETQVVDPPPSTGSDETADPSPDATPSTTPGGAPAKPNLANEDVARFDEWFKKHNIQNTPEVMDQDTDADGYSNREEFVANTNPRDPNSLPGVLEGVSVKEMKEVRVPMILREVNKGSTKARVARTDGGTDEELAVGATPKGLPYKVTSVKHEVKADKHGVNTDVSNITLENPATKETVILIRDLPARTNETHAVITGPGGVEKKVHLEETVELPGLPGRQFKVLELRGDQVIVEELSTKRALTIPKR